MKLTMWLVVNRGDQPGALGGASDQLWRRTVDTGRVPDPASPDRDEQIVLYAIPDEDGERDPLEGPMWWVKRRHMDADGGWHIELATAIIDPTPEVRALFRGSRHTAWYTDRDGDLRANLQAGGWHLTGDAR